MTEHVVVEWGGQSGGGFVQYADPLRGAPPDPAFVKAARGLQDDLVHQPPEDARDNDRFPVWGLQHVDVEQHGPHWCFTVQGRGGAFGRAGGCQFLFVPGTADPAEVWTAGAALVGADGRIGHRPHGGVLPPVAAERFVGPLTALVERRHRVVVDGDPAEVAAVIGGLVAVLPAAVVGDHVWLTFPLITPVLDPRPSVTGRWPAELADTPNARRVVRWLEGTSDEPPHDLPPRADEAIRWLAHLAAAGRRTPEHRALPSLRALLDVVVRDELAITAADVGGLVRAHDRRLRDGTNPGLVREWATAHPDAVIDELLRPLPSWLEQALSAGLWEAWSAAGEGRNPARFPPAPAPAGWHTRLGELVRARYPVREDLLRFVRDELVAPGKPLGSAELVHRHQDWLARLGISPDDPSTGVFPVPTNAIVAALAQTGRISEVHREFLRCAPDPVEAIRSVLAHLPVVTPAHALALMAVPSQDDDVRRVLETALDRTDPRAEPAADWLGALLSTARSQRVKATVLPVGYHHLRRLAAGPLPTAFLSPVLRYWGETDQDDIVSGVLLDAAAELQPRQRHREPDPVPPQEVWTPIAEARPPAQHTAPAEHEPFADDAELSVPPWAATTLVAIFAVVVLYLLVSSVLGRLGT